MLSRKTEEKGDNKKTQKDIRGEGVDLVYDSLTILRLEILNSLVGSSFAHAVCPCWCSELLFTE